MLSLGTVKEVTMGKYDTIFKDVNKIFQLIAETRTKTELKSCLMIYLKDVHLA